MVFKAKDGYMVMSLKGRIMKFKNGIYSTTNKDDIAILKNCKGVSEVVDQKPKNKG